MILWLILNLFILTRFSLTQEGILVLSNNSLPAELPMDASIHFGQSLLPWLYEMATAPISEPPQIAFSSKTLADAVVTWKGALTEKYQYIDQINRDKISERKRVLVLGSGYISRPVVEYLMKEGNIDITVASNVFSDAKSICDSYTNAQPAFLNALDEKQLENFVSTHEVVLSLLPPKFHTEVARTCLIFRKHLITASYTSGDLQSFHKR